MMIEAFERECQRMRIIGDQYNDQCQRILAEASRKVVRKEYSVGGEIMHRGYYCPNPIADIVIRNAKRGRLLKRMTARSNPYYEYGFDCEGKLLIIRRPDDTEFIIRDHNNVELGIIFHENQIKYPEVTGISECTYNQGKIQTYIYYRYCVWDPAQRTYERINYKYSEEGLSIADWFEYMDSQFMRHWKYYFVHDEEGILTHYKVETYKGEIINNIKSCNRMYDIPVRRKI